MRLAKLGGLAVRIVGGDDGSGGGAGPVVVFLHGFGAPADDLIPLAGALPVPRGTRFAFPGAPLAMPGAWGGGRAWWMIDVGRFERASGDGIAALADDVPAGLAEAHAHVAAMLDALVELLGVSYDKIALGGFSQGAMLSCDVALRSGKPFAGIALMSGVMLCRPEWLRLLPERRGLRVFQSHGTRDPLLPFSLACELRDAMAAAGLDVDWLDFPGGHEIQPAVLAGVSAFLGRVLT